MAATVLSRALCALLLFLSGSSFAFFASVCVSIVLQNSLQPVSYSLVLDTRLSARGKEQMRAMLFSDKTELLSSAAAVYERLRHNADYVHQVTTRRLPSRHAIVTVSVADPFALVDTETTQWVIYNNGAVSHATLLNQDVLTSAYAVSVSNNISGNNSGNNSEESLRFFIRALGEGLLRIRPALTLISDAGYTCKKIRWISPHMIRCHVIQNNRDTSCVLLLDSKKLGNKKVIKKALELHQEGIVATPCEVDVRFDQQIVFRQWGKRDEEA